MTLEQATANRERLEALRMESREAYRAYVLAEEEEGRIHSALAAERFEREAEQALEFAGRCRADLGVSPKSDRTLWELIEISESDAPRYRAAAVRYRIAAQA